MNLVLLAAGVGSRFKGKFDNKILLKINKKLRIFDIINNSFSNAKIKKNNCNWSQCQNIEKITFK
tara:strand:+ start:393 stop:587 length:195 start_codon:yes stop_codon:yes gene_type:complete